MIGSLRSWVGRFFGEAIELDLGTVISVGSVDVELLSGGKHIGDVAIFLGVEQAHVFDFIRTFFCTFDLFVGIRFWNLFKFVWKGFLLFNEISFICYGYL